MEHSTSRARREADSIDGDFDTIVDLGVLSNFPHHDPTVQTESTGSATDEGVPGSDTIFDYEPSLGYEVDSLVAVNTKPMVHKLREIFKISDDIGVILPGSGIIPCILPPRETTIFVDQLFVGHIFPFTPLVRQFLRRVRILMPKNLIHTFYIFINSLVHLSFCKYGSRVKLNNL